MKPLKPISRRELLAASALTALGIPLLGPLGQPLGSRAAASVPGVSSAAAPPLKPLAPYGLVADSTLSEDYFLSSEVQFDPATDTVYSVIRSDGSLAAVVLSQATIYLVTPDPTSPTGYSNTTVNHPLPGIASMSAAAGAGNTVLIGVLVQNGSIEVITLDPQGVVASAVPVPMTSQFPLAQAVSFVVDTGGAARLAVLGTAGGVQYQLFLFDPVTKTTSQIPVDTTTLTNEAPDFAINVLEFAAGPPSGGAVYGVAWSPSNELALLYGVHSLEAHVIGGNGNDVASVLLAPPLPTPDPAHLDHVAAVLYADTDGDPAMIICDALGNVVGSPLPLLRATGLNFAPGPVTKGTWFQDPTTGVITCYLLAGTTIYLQTIDLKSVTPVSLPIPLQTGVEALYLPSRGLTSDTVLLLGTPSTLFDKSVLSMLGRRTGTGTWLSAPIAAGGSPTSYPIDTYRTMLTLTDATDMPMPGYDLTVTAALDAMAFRPTGAIPLPAGVATKIPTDAWGQLCLATAATALNASSFVVSWDDGTGARKTQTVTPDSELHAFLAGGGPLNGYSSVADALTNNAGAGKALPNLPAGAVPAVSSAITAAMKAGADPTNPQAATPFTLSGLGTPTITHSPTADLRLLNGADSWWDQVKHDVESVWKAVQTGVAKVSQVVSAFDASVGTWVVSLTIAIEGYVAAAINYAITDLRSAVVAIHGILHALGADVTAAVKFLRTLVSDLMKDAKVIGNALYGWLTFDPADPGAAGAGLAYTNLKGLAPKLHGAFSRAKADLQTSLSSTVAEVGGSTVNGVKAKYSSGKAAGISKNVKANYLHEKTRSTTVPDAPPSAASQKGAAGLGTLVAAHSAATSAAVGSRKSLPPFTDPHELLAKLDVAGIAKIILDMIDVVLDLLEDIIDGLLDVLISVVEELNAALRQPLDDLPLIGDLLAALGVPGDLSFGKLLCYVTGFGAAVVGDLVFDGHPWLPPALGSTRVRYRNASLQAGLDPSDWRNLLGVSQVFANVLLAAPTLAMDLKKQTDAPLPAFIGRMGVGFEVLVNVLNYPFSSTKGDQLHWTPQSVPNDSLLMDPGNLWYLGFAPAGFDALATALPLSTPASPNAFLDSALPIIDFGLGTILLIEGAVLTAQENPDHGDKRNAAITGAVFGWISTVLKVLTVKGIPEPVPLVSVGFDIGMLAANAVLGVVALEL